MALKTPEGGIMKMAKGTAVPRTPTASRNQNSTRTPSTPPNPPHLNSDSDSEMTSTSQFSEMETPPDWTPTNRNVESEKTPSPLRVARGNGTPRGRGRGVSCGGANSPSSTSPQIERRGRGRPKKVQEDIPVNSMEIRISNMRAEQAKRKQEMENEIEVLSEVILQGKIKEVTEKAKDDIAIAAAPEVATETHAARHTVAALQRLATQQHQLHQVDDFEPAIIAEDGDYIPVRQDERDEFPNLPGIDLHGQHDVNKVPVPVQEERDDSSDVAELPELNFDQQYDVKSLYSVASSNTLPKIPAPKLETICEQLLILITEDDVLMAVRPDLYKNTVEEPQPMMMKDKQNEREDKFYYDIAGITDDVPIVELQKLVGVDHEKDEPISPHYEDEYDVPIEKRLVESEEVDIFEEASKLKEDVKQKEPEKNKESAKSKQPVKSKQPTKPEQSPKKNQPANDESEKPWHGDFDPMDFSSQFPSCKCPEFLQKKLTGIRPIFDAMDCGDSDAKGESKTSDSWIGGYLRTGGDVYDGNGHIGDGDNVEGQNVDDMSVKQSKAKKSKGMGKKKAKTDAFDSSEVRGVMA